MTASPPGQHHARPAGVGYAVASAALFGLSTPCSRVLLDRVDPTLLAGLLYLGAGLGVALVRVVRKRRVPDRVEHLVATDTPWLAGAVVSGGVIAPLLLLHGLRVTPAADASLLLNLESVFTALIAWILAREHVDRRLVVGFALIVAGSLALSWQPWRAPGSWHGAAAIAGACACWAIDNNLTRRVSASDPLRIVIVKGIAAGCVNTVAGFAMGGVLPRWQFVAAAGVLGFASYGVSLVLFVLALRHLGTSRTSAYFALGPFIGAGASVLVLHDRVGALWLGAAALIGIGVALHLAERHGHAHRHAATRHEHAHSHDEHHAHDHGSADARDGHTHEHTHTALEHSHPHYPDVHHRHEH